MKQGVKWSTPSQIGGRHRADEVERGAIRGKQRKPRVEREVIRERRDRKVRGPATRDVIWPKGHKPHLEISEACHLWVTFSIFQLAGFPHLLSQRLIVGIDAPFR